MTVSEGHGRGPGMYTTPSLMSDLVGVVARLREITVEVRAWERAGGAGVIWSADGLVVTSAHVLASADRGGGGAHPRDSGAHRPESTSASRGTP